MPKASSLGKNCVYCHKVFNIPNERTPSLAALPPNRSGGSFNKNLLEVINSLIPQLSSMYPNFSKLSSGTNFRGLEDRFLCGTCAKHLLEAYEAVEKLESLKSSESLISSHCNSKHHESTQKVAPQVTKTKESDDDDKPRVKPSKAPEVPAGAVIREMWRNSRKRQIIVSKVKKEAYKELRKFTKVTKCLKMDGYCGNTYKDETLFASRDKDLEKEMELWCPTLLELFYGIFTRRVRYREFNVAIRMAVAIAAFNMSSKCSGFQKNLGFLMYENNAPVKVWSLT